MSPNGDGEELFLEPVLPKLKPIVEQVFEAWVASTGKPRSVLDGKRRRLIEQALKSYPLEDLLDAVDGWRFSPHHRGDNDSRMVYNRLELILRDAEHIEQFREFKRAGQVWTPADRRSREAEASQDQLRDQIEELEAQGE